MILSKLTKLASVLINKNVLINHQISRKHRIVMLKMANSL